MEDGYSMFDYNINVNDVIQLMVKPVLTETNTNTSSKPASSKQGVEGKENSQVRKQLTRSFSGQILFVLSPT